MKPKEEIKFDKERIFHRNCSKCGKEIPTNITEEVYICCDCRKKQEVIR